jgi:hypothetical protein
MPGPRIGPEETHHMARTQLTKLWMYKKKIVARIKKDESLF